MRRGAAWRWQIWLVVLLVMLNAGWMLFDGARALIVGEYVTPRSGPHAGQLGPWSMVVEAAGIDPMSSLMKWIFVVYGTAFIAVLIEFVRGASWAWWGMILVALLGLWHLPFGTLINVLVIALLQLSSLKTPRADGISASP